MRALWLIVITDAEKMISDLDTSLRWKTSLHNWTLHYWISVLSIHVFSTKVDVVQGCQYTSTLSIQSLPRGWCKIHMMELTHAQLFIALYIGEIPLECFGLVYTSLQNWRKRLYKIGHWKMQLWKGDARFKVLKSQNLLVTRLVSVCFQSIGFNQVTQGVNAFATKSPRFIKSTSLKFTFIFRYDFIGFMLF